MAEEDDQQAACEVRNATQTCRAFGVSKDIYFTPKRFLAVSKSWFSNKQKLIKYRGANKGLYVLLSRTQAGPGTTVKQEQEEISRNHVQTFSGCSVLNTPPN